MIDDLTHGGVTALPDWGLIRARGDEAASFLQGQLTNDVATLAQGEARLAGYCSAKGRLLASFVVWRNAPDEILLACSADVLAPTLKRLSMYVMRARCKLSDATPDLRLLGLVGASATAWLGAQAPDRAWMTRARGDTTAVRLPDAPGVARYLCVQPTTAPALDLPVISSTRWSWLEVVAGVPRIVAANIEQFVPQMINFELVGGVSFSKGCYPGQEVVARSQYRGTLKRRMARFDVAVPAVDAGAELFHDADPSQPAGRVVLAAADPARDGAAASLLAEVKLEALASGRLHLGSPDGALLQPQTLPYTVTVDRE